MKVSIIIPVYNRVEYTQKCLESIFKFGSKYAFEIIVVNNASTDGTREFLQSIGEKIVLIENVKNLGFAKACNLGGARATGEYLLFLNNDTIVTENWIESLVEILDQDQEVAIVGNKLLFADEKIQHAGVVFGEDKIPYHIYYREIKEKHYLNKKRFFKAVTGACMMIRKKTFIDAGGFDETYINGLEDIDLCLKVGELNFKIIYCPDSVVYHLESVSENRFKYAQQNVDYFLKKWGDKIVSDERNYLLEDGNLKKSDEFKCIIEKQKNELNELIVKIQQRDQELALMKNSKFWKVRDLYLKIKNKFK